MRRSRVVAATVLALAGQESDSMRPARRYSRRRCTVAGDERLIPLSVLKLSVVPLLMVFAIISVKSMSSLLTLIVLAVLLAPASPISSRHQFFPPTYVRSMPIFAGYLVMLLFNCLIVVHLPRVSNVINYYYYYLPSSLTTSADVKFDGTKQRADCNPTGDENETIAHASQTESSRRFLLVLTTGFPTCRMDSFRLQTFH